MTELRDRILDGPPGRPALLAPGRRALTYGGLADLLESTERTLFDLELGPPARVATLLPNGPETAALSLALLCSGCLAPMNPALRESDVRDALEVMRIDALVVPRGSGFISPETLAGLGVVRIEIESTPAEPAGTFVLRAEPTTRAVRPHHRAADTALLLPTSGTTGGPKIVPLSRANLLASAESVAAALELTPDDRCLSLMPLFHIHGLVANLLAPHLCGSASFQPGPFDGLRFFAWLEEAQPTWFSAVPTMHQAILARAARNASRLAQASLRFVRSSSAALPPPVARRLEEVFRCVAVEAYGMTEASHQIASNSTRRSERRLGSVGRATGVEIRVREEDGSLHESGCEGEIVIRGRSVTRGYEDAPGANRDAFLEEGWFRTGDRGIIDRDGHVTLTGRLKELINRGGEKISPIEVDNALAEHPGVAQVAAFALPHDRLGEEVAAVVVAREDFSLSERELLQFAASRLPAFKRPRHIFLREDLPKGPTGKLQRIGLAERLGLS